jgi:hypothetical protein
LKLRIISTTRRHLTGLAAAGLLAAGMLTVSASPAAAHTEAQALAACGPGYSVVNDAGGIGGKAKRPVTTNSGAVWGYVYLLYNSNGNNCVVTRKTAFHGTPTRTVAELGVQQSNGSIAYYTDPVSGQPGNYSHYANVAHFAADRCVTYYGFIWNVPAEQPGGTLADGGRATLGNCG